MAGLKVVPVSSLPVGSLDLEDLKAKATKHKDNLAAFMVRRQPPSCTQILRAHADHVPLDLRCLRAWFPGCEGYVRSGHDLN